MSGDVQTYRFGWIILRTAGRVTASRIGAAVRHSLGERFFHRDREIVFSHPLLGQRYDSGDRYRWYGVPKRN